MWPLRGDGAGRLAGFNQHLPLSFPLSINQNRSTFSFSLALVKQRTEKKALYRLLCHSQGFVLHSSERASSRDRFESSKRISSLSSPFPWLVRFGERSWGNPSIHASVIHICGTMLWLQSLIFYYSWWLPSHRRLVLDWLVRGLGDCILRQSRWICEGLLWFPGGVLNSNSSGLLESLSYLTCGRSLRSSWWAWVWNPN